jgi:hypothetical protein
MGCSVRLEALESRSMSRQRCSSDLPFLISIARHSPCVPGFAVTVAQSLKRFHNAAPLAAFVL